MRGPFEQGDRKSQQSELELVLELDIRVCGRKKKCMGERISGGGPPWAHEAGGAPRGVGRARHPRGQVGDPPAVFSVPNILKYSRKIIFKFQGIWELLFSGYFYIARINQKTDRKILFLLYFN